MNEDTEVYLELTDDEHEDAKAAAEDTARLLIGIKEQRKAEDRFDASSRDDPESQEA